LPETEPPRAPDASLRQDLWLIGEVAREAGRLAAHYFDAGFRSWEKTPGDPVTDADLAVDALIRNRLRTARPDYGWLSEETADDPARLRCHRLWVVDPIDGTRAFMKGRDGFCVSIALVEADRPVLGALYAPVRGLFFQAQAGAGATLNGRPIRSSARPDLAQCRMLADAPLFTRGFWPEPWPAMRIDKPNSIALRVALVACGLADAAIALGTKSEWDMAAACLIMDEAGGLCTDRHGQPMRFNQQQPSIPSVIAAGPGLHAELMRRVRAGLAARQASAGRHAPE